MFEVIRTDHDKNKSHSPSRHHAHLNQHNSPYSNHIQLVKTISSASILPPRTPEHLKYSYKTIFKVYFNFTFCMCISPFRFCKVVTPWDKGVTYRMKKATPQMVSWGKMRQISMTRSDKICESYIFLLAHLHTRAHTNHL